MRRSAVVVALLVTSVASIFAYRAFGTSEATPAATTTRVTRGDVVEAVGATGQLQAVTTVQVGSQVSGTILELKADFNSLVRKGQVLARLDPSLLQTQIEQARANLIRAQADLDRLRVAADDADTKLRRAQDLSERSSLPPRTLTRLGSPCARRRRNGGRRKRPSRRRRPRSDKAK